MNELKKRKKKITYLSFTIESNEIYTFSRANVTVTSTRSVSRQ